MLEFLRSSFLLPRLDYIAHLCFFLEVDRRLILLFYLFVDHIAVGCHISQDYSLVLATVLAVRSSCFALSCGLLVFSSCWGVIKLLGFLILFWLLS